MEPKSYPVLVEDFSLSRVITEKGDSILLYNTATQMKARLNEATFEFAKRCRGDKPLEEIISELAHLSGERPEKVYKDLSPLVKVMVENEMIYSTPSPLNPPRPEAYEAELQRRLSSVQLEITRQCNLHCKHCYNNSGAKRENELTVEEMKELIDELAHIGVLNVLVTGGEPLLHPDLFEIISYVRSKPMSCMVFTNGTLITKEVIHTFKKLGVLSVTLSLDGFTALTHDTFRGGKSFERVIKAVAMLKEAGIPVRINISMHKGILDEVCDLLELLGKWGITEHYLWPISYTGRAKGEDFTITPDEYEKTLRHIKEYERTSGEEKKRLPYNRDQTTCGIGMSNLVIRSTGVVVPCPAFPETMSLGSIREESVAEIWNNSPLLNKMRHMSPLENEKCKECPHVKVCGGGCMAEIYRRTGELGHCDPFECAYFEVYSDYVPVKLDKEFLSVEIR